VSQTLVGFSAHAWKCSELLALLYVGMSIVDNNNELGCDEIYLLIFFPFRVLMNLEK
jgi:hypothetical protein